MSTFAVQERPLSLTGQAEHMVGDAVVHTFPTIGLPLGAADAISRFTQQHPQAARGFMQGAMQNPLGSPYGLIPGGNILQGIFNMLQQLFDENNGDNEQYFQNANGGSVGDPHLSFNGKTWDNMGSQPDLLHSDSIPGGYQVSTQTTAPAANGVTFNDSATVTTNYGETSVTMDKSGNVTISQYGNSFSLQPGQGEDLGNGEFAQRNPDGSLAITCNNGEGGNITTTMRTNGHGVDVTTTANNVDLGGALVDGAGGQHTWRSMGYAHHHRPLL